jgi:HEAT repeat protein
MHEDYNIINMVLNIIVQVGKPEYVKYVVPLLSDEKPIIIDAAIRTIAKIGRFEDAKILQPLLAHENVNTKALATDAYITIIKPQLENEDENIRLHAIESLVIIGEKSIRLIQPLLLHSDIATRIKVIEIIGIIGNASHVELIAPLLDEQGTKDAAIKVIGKIGLLEHIRLLAKFPKSEIYYAFEIDNEITTASGEAVNQIKTRSTNIETLKSYLNHNDSSTRALAIEMIGDTRNSEYCGLIIPHLNHESKIVRYAAIDAMEKLKCYQHLDTLMLLLPHEDIQTGEKAKGVLIKLAQNAIKIDNSKIINTAIQAIGVSGSSYNAYQIIPFINEPEYQDAVLDSLINIGGKKEIEFLEQFILKNKGRPTKTGEVLNKIKCREALSNLKDAESKLSEAKAIRKSNCFNTEHHSHLLETSAHKYLMKAAEYGFNSEAATMFREWAIYFRKIGKEGDAYLLDLTASHIIKDADN